MRVTIEDTIEELVIGNGYWGTVDVSLTFDISKEEPRTHDYPGFPSQAELLEVTHSGGVDIYDARGTILAPNVCTTKEIEEAIQKHVDERLDRYQEEAIEAANEEE